MCLDLIWMKIYPNEIEKTHQRVTKTVRGYVFSFVAYILEGDHWPNNEDFSLGELSLFYPDIFNWLK